VPFPNVEGDVGKLRPVLLLCRVPGSHDDYVACMISSRVHQAVPGLDVVFLPDEPDFAATGLKVASLARLGRLATLSATSFRARLGRVSLD